MTDAADPSNWQTPPTDDRLAYSFDFDIDLPAAGSPADIWPWYIPARLLELTVRHYPVVGICVIVVDGELDTFTAPLLEERVCEQLRAAPRRLILDLESVRFLGASGLSCLLRAREHTEQATGAHLHLAGLTNRIAAHALNVSGLRALFDTYPTLIHAVATLADHSDITISDNLAAIPVMAAVWCCSVGTSWTLELRELDRDTGPGAIVDWISSGVPVSQPKPDTLTYELLAARGLRLFPDPFPEHHISSRHRIGYVCANDELITLAHLVRDQAARPKLRG